MTYPEEWDTVEAGFNARRDSSKWNNKAPEDLLMEWMEYILHGNDPNTQWDRGRGVIAHCLEELKAGGQTEVPKTEPESERQFPDQTIPSIMG